MTTRPAGAVRLESDAAALEAAAALAAWLAPGAADRDRAGAVPREALAALDASGLLGITIPVASGGPGASPATLAEVIRRIAAVDPAIAQVPQGHFLVLDAFAVLGTDAQRAAAHERVLDGARIAASLAERGGRHAQDLATRITGPPGDRRVTGRKFYATGALTAGLIAVNALGDDGRVTLALVDRGDPGVGLDEDWTAMGQRATVSGSLTLADVPVALDAELPWADAFSVPQQLGARAQLVHTAIEVGIAGGALETAARLADAGDPRGLADLGRLAGRVRAAERLLTWAAEELARVGLIPADADAAARGSVAVAQAKAFGCEVAVEAATAVIGLGGPDATARGAALDRHWRNSRTHAVHDPVDWKYHHVGAHAVDGRHPPNHGQI